MKKKILVVDDDWTVLELLNLKLSDEGFEVLTATDEGEFLMMARTRNPDLIILDIWLKSQLGTDLYHRLLESGFDRTVPVIFITALLEENHPPTRASDGRKYALFGKPFDVDELVCDIQKLLP